MRLLLISVVSMLFMTLTNLAQAKKIKLLSADLSTVDEQKYPDAILLIGNVKMEHEGAFLECKRAILYSEKNIFNAIGDVVLEQGDSIIQYSDFAYYDGNKKIAKSWGNVEINDKTMKLSTDTIYFNRVKHYAHYPTHGTITDKKNTLKSKSGTYYFNNKRFTAKTNVKITNPENRINSDKLDYYTDTKLAYLYGNSIIKNLKDSTVITSQKGFYDTNKDVSYFVKRTKITLKSGRTIEGDSMYYNKKKGFASSTKNIKITDTVNNMITKGNYAEVFEKKDSLFITKRAVNIKLMDKDSLYIHGDSIFVTGKPKDRLVRTYFNVLLYKKDLQGSCDSITSSEKTGLTTMYNKPILWSGNSQMTGDTIQFLANKETKKLDSLFIINNGFINKQDSIDKNIFNQIKGRNIKGKFVDNQIKTLLVNGNAQSLYFNRNEDSKKLETITTMMSSDIEFTFEDNNLIFTKYLKQVEGKTYPPSKFPEEDKKLKGFIWRPEEQPKNSEDIFRKPIKSKAKKEDVNTKQKKHLKQSKRKEDNKTTKRSKAKDQIKNTKEIEIENNKENNRENNRESKIKKENKKIKRSNAKDQIQNKQEIEKAKQKFKKLEKTNKDNLKTDLKVK